MASTEYEAVTPEIRETQPREARESIQKNWIWIALLGAALVAGGVAAVAAPVLAGIAVTTLVGVVMIVAAGLQAYHAFRSQGWRARAWSFVSALIYLAGGVLLLADPFAGTIALSLVMLAVFLADGVARIVIGLRIRPDRGWGWLTVTGALGAGLALVLMLFFLPGASLTLLGIVAGVNLLMEGWAFIFLAFATRPESDRNVYPDVADRASERGADHVVG